MFSGTLNPTQSAVRTGRAYRRLIVVCCAACPPQWTEYEDQNSIYGVRNDSHRTVPACQDYCASVAACVAIDFDFNDDSCWLHLQARDLLEENTFSQQNTTQYQINRTCEPATSTSGLSDDHDFHRLHLDRS